MKNSAFSLVELSIVLVILGLLVGGVLSGQSLIHAAQLRSVAEEHDKYVTAVHTFKDKYFALPGDMTNATAFWGSAGGSGSDATCSGTVGTGTQTCNGNGDGMLDVVPVYEQLRFWQHLANAGMIEGTYSGTGTLTTDYPATKYSSQGFWEVMTSDYQPPDTNAAMFGQPAGNMLILVSTAANAEVITPTDAWNIDTKMDDGKPGTGTLISIKGIDPVTDNCTTAANVMTDSPADYTLSATGILCNLLYVSAF